MDNLVGFISYIAIMSIAAERFTEIMKKIMLAKLIEKYEWKATLYQVLAALFGGVICYLNPPTSVPFYVHPGILSVLVGFCVSGGSGVWNDLLGILKQTKDANKPG